MDKVFGEETPDLKAAGGGSTSRRAAGLRRVLLDSVYLGGLCVTLPYLAATGRAHRVVDHIPRRSRDIPPRRGTKPCLWIHGVSVGEILSARQFLKLFTAEFAEWDVVLSTTTRAGLEVSRMHYPGTQIVSYPFDLSYLVKRAFDRIRPDVILIVEHELWPNFLWHADARGIPVAIVNGRLSERSLRGYKWLSRFVRWPPAGIKTFCVEDEVSAEGFRKLGVESDRIHVTGNFKFDNAPRFVPGIREELGLAHEDWVLACASTHAGEEEILLDSFAEIHRADGSAKLILAPRHIERAGDLLSMARRKGLGAHLWSRMSQRNGSNGAAGWERNGHGEVLLVDTMGDLDRLTGAADVVFVGGSLVPFGGHNVIAPAGMGRPVVIGPHHSNFRSVVSAFLSRDALVVAKDAPDLTRKLQELKGDPVAAGGVARRASETVASHAGASERTLDVLRPLFEAARLHTKVSSVSLG